MTAPQSLQHRIEEAADKHAVSKTAGLVDPAKFYSFQEGAQFVLDLLAKGEGEHPPHLWVGLHVGHFSPTPSSIAQTEYCAVSELQVARSELGAAKAEVASLEMALNGIGVDYGSELEKKDAQYISCVKQRMEFRDALMKERQRLSLAMAALEKIADAGITTFEREPAYNYQSMLAREALEKLRRGHGGDIS